MHRRSAFLLLAALAPLCLLRADPQGARTRYRGREIAPTMSAAGAGWLTREERAREEDAAALLEALDVREGERVCDLGCGNGFHTLPLAERVGESGRVFAVDVQPEMLALLAQRAEAAGLAGRIEPILADASDPHLPERALDLVLLVDVYHELDDPEDVLAAVRKSLVPGGRMVLVEFREEDPKVPILPLHKMSKRQVLREVLPNGFRLVEEFDALPWQHALFFARASEGELARAARLGLMRACAGMRALAVHGGYAERVELASSARSGESELEAIGPAAISVNAPGTPAVGAVYLRAFRATGEDAYWDAARETGRALAWAQNAEGGWDRFAELSGLGPGDAEPVRASGRTSFDDDATQGALRFLVDLVQYVPETWCERAVELGLARVLRAQREDGAWPLELDERGRARAGAALSVDATASCVELLAIASERGLAPEGVEAVARGANFLIAAQRGGWPGRVGADGAPLPDAPGEPASLRSATTAHALEVLASLRGRTKEERFDAPIARAAAWLERVRREDGTWARAYESESGRALEAAGRATAEDVRSIERALVRSRRAPPSGASKVDRAQALAAEDRFVRELEPLVRERLAALDDRGLWVRRGAVQIEDFVRGAGLACDLLEHAE